MRVLVVRPQASAERTATKLSALGHTPAVVALVKPVHDPQAAMAGLSRQHSAIAITSAEAARVLRSIEPDIDRHLLTTVFAVGRATARAASESGFRTVLAAEGSDGNSLADLILSHRQQYGVPADPLLYLAGVPRSRQLEKRLDAEDVSYDVAECYRMEAIRPKRTELRPLIVDEHADAVLLYSREAARHFFELPLVNEHLDSLENTLFMCISRNVASVVPERFSKSVVVAAMPTEEALLDLL
ncbi:uroporphyrinogen-III synthase [Mycoplana rhizolycopersici]|uniref:Uroporphyrinogen-III synthase n=1 Tax=Mycoplana rhizolycopersici TaxID=2746702 RepID=A0ABX2QBN8_9HYPH|nr:uroporphyrinogen-III synthase [Rhizobium rhizolycopersici]NVP53806.1 uroporphyrinogen-III synthase [Rhizobium rhizolycopersici]